MQLQNAYIGLKSLGTKNLLGPFAEPIKDLFVAKLFRKLLNTLTLKLVLPHPDCVYFRDYLNKW